jgi:hypothetical protein
MMPNDVTIVTGFVGWVGGMVAMSVSGPSEMLSTLPGAMVVSVLLSVCSGVGTWLAGEIKRFIIKKWKNRK